MDSLEYTFALPYSNVKQTLAENLPDRLRILTDRKDKLSDFKTLQIFNHSKRFTIGNRVQCK